MMKQEEGLSIREKKEKFEQEQEEKAEKASELTLVTEFEEGSTLKEGQKTETATLIIANHGNATAFTEVLLSNDKALQLTISALPGQTDDEEEDKPKPKEQAKIYKSSKSDSYFLLASKKVGSLATNEIVEYVNSILKPSKTLILDSIAKSYVQNYFDFETLPLGVLATSEVTKEETKALSSDEVVFKDGVTSLAGGFLSYAQIFKQHAVCLISVIDIYQFGLETFEGFEPALTNYAELGAHATKVSQFRKLADFKTVLTKYNNNDHLIYN